MDFHEVMLERNASFARTDFSPELKMMPSTGTIVVGCVDPANVVGWKLGETAIIPNIGGRVTRPRASTSGSKNQSH